MIGSCLVEALLKAGHRVIGIDIRGDVLEADPHFHYQADLSDEATIGEIMEKHKVDRMIHLAALAHTDKETDLSWERYCRINVRGAESIFRLAQDRPLLFVSTVDVFGFYDGKEPLRGSSPVKPVSLYARSKAMAEERCKELKQFDIFRFSPVYTPQIKRDIQKRYYLKYPRLAYRIGKGSSYEVLSIDKALQAMTDWCREEPGNKIRILKDDEPLWTPEAIRREKQEGRAGLVLWVPRWLVCLGYGILKRILGETEKVYLLNKAVHPYRSE